MRRRPTKASDSSMIDMVVQRRVSCMGVAGEGVGVCDFCLVRFVESTVPGRGLVLLGSNSEVIIAIGDVSLE